MLQPYMKVLKNRNFMYLWLGQIISQFGDRLTQMAIFGFIFQRFAGNPSAMANAKVIFFTLLPVFLINPVAGVYVDRWGKRKTMYVADLIRAGLILILGLFLLNASIIMFVYILIFMVFCVGRFFIPARMAIVPSIVDKEDIVMANSLISVTAMISGVIGFGVGGLIVEWWGPKGGFMVDALTFLVSAALIYQIKAPPVGEFHASDLVEMGKDEVAKAKCIFREAKEGIRQLRNNDSMIASFKNMAVLFSILGSLYIVFIVFVQANLGAATGSVTGTKDVGLLAVWISVGLFLGSIAYGRISNKFPLKPTIYAMLFFASIFLIIFAFVVKFLHAAVAACFIAIILGIFIAPVYIACNSLIHQNAEDKVLGRLFSNLEIVMQTGFVIFMFTTAFLADIFSPFTIFMLIGLIVLGYSAYSFANEYRNKSFDDEQEISNIVG